MLYKLTIT